MKILTNYNFTQNEIQNVSLQKLADAPSTPVEGQIYYNTKSTNKRAYYFNGTIWVGMDASDAAMTGSDIVAAINASTSTISDARLSTDANTAITKAHDAVTIESTTGITLTLDGQKIKATPVFGSTEGTICQGNDTRLSDSRTPKSHTHGNITDDGKIGTESKKVLITGDGGAITTTSGIAGEFLKHDGTWGTPVDTVYTHPTYTYATPTNSTFTELASIDLLSTLTQTNGHVTGATKRFLIAGSNVSITASNNGGITIASSYVDTITKLKATGGTAVTGEVLVQGNGLISTSQTGNTITISTTATNNTGTVTKVSSGNGMNFTDFTTSGTVTLGTPTTITGSTTNSVTTNSHTHALTVTKTDVGLSDVTNDAQVKKIDSSIVGNIPTWSVATGDQLGTGYTVETTLNGATTAIPRADAVKSYVDGLLSANDAMIFKGTIGTGGTVTQLPTTHDKGWTYRVITAGTYADIVCEIGDLIISLVERNGSGNANADWTVAQANIDGAVVGPTSSTDGNFALFNGASGKIIKNSTYSPSSFATSGHNHDTVYTKKKVQTIGDNSATSFTVTHNFNTRDLVVTIREAASPYAQVITDVEFTTVNTITVKFAKAPASSEYIVTVIG